jgi:hypothetical protein
MTGSISKLNLAGYAKFITAFLGQALTYAALYYGGNHYVALATGVAAALGVYAVPNKTAPPVVTPPTQTPPVA